MRIAHIVAADKNNVIGLQGKMPWPRLSNDLKRFKQMTMGHPIIMGRKTFDSLPNGKGLPGRKNIVISKQMESPDVQVFKDLGEALADAKKHKLDIFIIGGGEIYKQTIQLIDTIYLTEIDAEYNGDTFYPTISDEFRLVSKLTDQDNGIKTTFKVLERR